MKIIKLDVREDSELEGVDAVALVENPAIEIDFMAFNKHEFASFNDYPQQARKAAANGIKRNEKLGNKCGTQVGKVRAQQLAQGKPISMETIKRMRAFLIRQRDNYDLAVRRQDYDACGYISYLLWGGPAALPWAEKKLRQAGLLEEQNEKIIQDYFVKSADGFSVGDYVSFGFAGKTKDKDRSRGQIKDIRVEGTVKVPGSSFEFKPTKDNPLALIKLKSGQTVGQYTKNLRKIQKPEGFSTEELYYEVIKDVLNDDKKHKFSAINEEKQLLAGPLMVADKLIPRIDENGEKYYVFFDDEAIKKLSYKLMKNKLIDSVNIEHDPNRKMADISLVETWLVEDPEKDKSSIYGYNLPKGSWFGIYKVNNKKVWDAYVKTGLVKGFSVEGIFNDKIVMQNAVT
jgi:hypothetical protein